MTRKIVIAIPNREYALRLAEYLRETEPGWETAAFTHESALRMKLQEPARIDALIGDASLLRLVSPLPAGVVRAAALVEEPGQAEGAWPELYLYRPLPTVAAGIRTMLSDAAPHTDACCRILTVFSAAGGAGKTMTALNLVRQAGERGWRTLYLNLEMLNVTSKLFGAGEPDSLSKLLYGLHTEPERFAQQLERSVRYHPYLRTDFIDAPDHPGERAAMTPELLERLVGSIRDAGRYDLIVADPDSGAGAWHGKLLSLSDRVAWLTSGDWQCLGKAERLLNHWGDKWPEWSGKISFVRNRGQGVMTNRWNLPAPPAAVLPYIPQWKGMDEPGRIFGASAFCGALDSLLDIWGLDRNRKEGMTDGSVGDVP